MTLSSRPRRLLWKRPAPGPVASWSGQGINRRGTSFWRGSPRTHHAGALSGWPGPGPPPG
eukprot:3586608-Alexandrium_andersonii.AAC.1